MSQARHRDELGALDLCRQVFAFLDAGSRIVFAVHDVDGTTAGVDEMRGCAQIVLNVAIIQIPSKDPRRPLTVAPGYFMPIFLWALRAAQAIHRRRSPVGSVHARVAIVAEAGDYVVIGRLDAAEPFLERNGRAVVVWSC